MDEFENYNSQQTDTRTENETPHVLTRRRVLNNENTWTQGGEHHTLLGVWEHGRDSRGWGYCGGITLGQTLNVGDGRMDGANHIAMYVPMQQSCMICTCTPKSKMQ